MKRHVLATVGILFTVGSLYLAFRGTDLKGVVEALSSVGYWWAIPVLGSTLVSIWIRAYRWKIMLDPVMPVSTSKTYSATMIGFMANNVLPMRLGEVVRAYAVGQGSGVSKSSALATIVVERAFDLLAVLLFLGLMTLRYSVAPWVKVAGYVALGACLGLFLTMGFLHWKPETAIRIFGFVIQRLPEKVKIQAEGLLTRFLAGLEVLSSGSRLAQVAVLSIATWLAMALGFYFTGVAFGMDLPPDSSLVMVAVCALAVMLPSGPGFIGTFEMGARYGLTRFGISEDLAISYALFYHTVQFFPITFIGFFYLWRQNLSLSRAVSDEEAQAP